MKQLLFPLRVTGRKMKVSDSQDRILVVELGYSPGMVLPAVCVVPATPHNPVVSFKRQNQPEVLKG